MSADDNTRLENLEKRLTSLESQFETMKQKLFAEGQASSTIKQANIQTGAMPGKDFPIHAGKPAVTTSPTISPRTTQAPPNNAKFLGFVGALCFILAASYFIKLAIDEGWLTPMRQLLGAIIFGLTLITIGFKIRSKDHQYATLLPGSGIVILFMSSYAGHLYYHLYNGLFATLLTNTISIGCVLLFRHFNANFYALAAILGTYLVPMLIDVSFTDLRQQSIYYLFWAIAYSAIAIALKNRLFIGLAAYLGIFTLAVSTIDLPRNIANSEYLYLAIFQAIQFLLFTFAVIIFSVKVKTPLTKKEAWSFFPVLLLFYATQYQLIYRLSHQAAPWCALAFAAIILGAYFIAKNLLPNSTFQSFPMVATFLSLVAVHALYLNILPPFLAPWFALLLLFGIANLRKNNFDFDEIWPAILILSWIILTEFYQSITTYDPTLESIFVNFSFSILIFLIARNSQEHEGNSKSQDFVTGLYLLSGLQFLCGQKFLTELFLPSSISNFATSALWSLSALFLLIFAKKFNAKKLATSSLIIFGIVATKLLLSDLSSSTPTTKIIALLFIGVLFYIGGFIHRKLGANQD